MVAVSRTFVVAVAMVCCASGVSAQTMTEEADRRDLISTDRPGIADGSKVIQPFRVQVETAFQAEFRRNGDTHTDTLFAPTVLRVGVAERLELRTFGQTVTATRQTFGTGPSATTTDFAPVAIGAKFAIRDSEQGPTLALIGRAVPPSGTGELSTEHVTGDVRLAMDWDVARHWSLNPNVGIARGEDRGATFGAALFAVTLNYLPTVRLNPFVDVGYESSTRPHGPAWVVIDGGVAYVVGRNFQFDASVGQGVSGDAPRPFVAIGVSIRHDLRK